MRGPTRELLADRDFRGFWLAQTALASINGTLRFAFVWLVVTLTDWSTAEGIVAGLLGLPAMMFSLVAGAWSDRVDRKRMFMGWTIAALVTLGAFTVVIAAGWATPLWAGVAAFAIGITVSVSPPNLNAMVPLLVGPDRLMNAVALQNGAMQAAGFFAVVIAGFAIDGFGDAAGFAVLTVLAGLSLLAMRPVTIPPDPVSTASEETFGASIISGLRYTWANEPVRSLVLLSMVLGSSFSVMQIAMPRVVEEDFGLDASSAGTVMATFGLGMFVSSAVMATRQIGRHGWNIALCVGLGLGAGQLALSFAPNFRVAVVIMLLWGLNAGIAMTSHRTVLQRSTAPEMMGRVMGLMMTGFMGGLPLGALTASVLSVWVGPARIMTIVGASTIVIAGALSWRPVIRRLT
ncbi:MAG: MFS transporter [Actinomycetota bacterium]